jgi:hypothetical protein
MLQLKCIFPAGTACKEGCPGCYRLVIPASGKMPSPYLLSRIDAWPKGPSCMPVPAHCRTRSAAARRTWSFSARSCVIESSPLAPTCVVLMRCWAWPAAEVWFDGRRTGFFGGIYKQWRRASQRGSKSNPSYDARPQGTSRRQRTLGCLHGTSPSHARCVAICPRRRRLPQSAHPACTNLSLGPRRLLELPLCVRESRTLLASARALVCINAAAQRVLWWRGSPLQRLIAASLP